MKLKLTRYSDEARKSLCIAFKGKWILFYASPIDFLWHTVYNPITSIKLNEVIIY